MSESLRVEIVSSVEEVRSKRSDALAIEFEFERHGLDVRTELTCTTETKERQSYQKKSLKEEEGNATHLMPFLTPKSRAS